MSEAEKANPVAVIRMQLDRMDGEFQSALPAHIPVERFKRVAMTAIQNNPDLLNADRRSLFNSAMRAAQDGLLPDGREGAIVVYRGKTGQIAQWMPMVQGILKKVRNSGEIATIVARVVYEGDIFRYWVDEDGEHILYEPSDTSDTNIVRRVFAMAKTKEGELYIEPMTPEEIEKVRQSSRAKDNGPWRDWWEEMAKKTAIRRLAKRLPMSTDLDDLIRRDDDLYDMRGASDAEVKPAVKQTTAEKLGEIAKQKTRDNEHSGLPGGEKSVADQRAEEERKHYGADKAIADNQPETDAEGGGEVDPPVTDDQVAAALAQGREARNAGRKQAACPQAVRASQRLFDAWSEGWAEADEEIARKNREDAEGEGGGE